MKTLIISFLSVCSVFVFAQNRNVGINTATPLKTLDVNGNARLRTTVDKSNDTTYDNALVTNTNGEIENWPVSKIKTEISTLTIEIKILQYNNSVAQPLQELKCGRFKFRFNNNAGVPMPQIGLITGDPVQVYYTIIQKKHANAGGTFPPFGKLEVNNSISVNTSWNNFNLATPTYQNNTMSEVYTSYPGDTNVYRITYFTRYNGQGNPVSDATAKSNINYTILCEKY